MYADELQRDGNREFMTELFRALRNDHSVGPPGKIRGSICSPEVNIKYRFAHGGNVGAFVRPRLVVTDKSDFEGFLKIQNKRILEIGDGVLATTHPYDGFLAGLTGIARRVFQRVGIPRIEPWNLDRMEYHNPEYFKEGSEAREFMQKRGYGFIFEPQPKEVHI